MSFNNKVQLITYPDSLGGDLKSLKLVLDRYFQQSFQGGIHILPFYPSTGDRGFSPISYFEIDPKLGNWKDLKALGNHYDLMVDLMVNHISSSSLYFQDFLKNGYASPYEDMFINVQKIWSDGNPNRNDLEKIFLRRSDPFSVFSVGSDRRLVKLWTTFGSETPSDQIDLDVNSPLTRDLFSNIIEHLARNGIRFLRLDAVGYVIKKPGTSGFFVSPEIYEFMDWMRSEAAKYAIELLPEVHAEYSTQLDLASHGYWIYDFMLPYLVLESLLLKKVTKLNKYLNERPAKQITMLDCHDGIPVKPDLNGYYRTEEVKAIIEFCTSRGGSFSRIYTEDQKDADGFDVHQIRGTYYSMLGESDELYYAARAIQLFTPGIPQIYYVGLLAGRNDLAAVEDTGEGREINRHNFSLAEVEQEITRPIVQKLLQLIDFRNNYPAFDGKFTVDSTSDDQIMLAWEKSPSKVSLKINLTANTTDIVYLDLKTHQMVHLG